MNSNVYVTIHSLGKDISGEKETLLLVGEMIMDGADIACSINEGCELVDRCVDIGITLGTFIYMYIYMNTYI
jgi:hypothetical protein